MIKIHEQGYREKISYTDAKISHGIVCVRDDLGFFMFGTRYMFDGVTSRV